MNRSHLVIAIRGWTDTGDWLLGGRPGGEIPAEVVSALEAALPEETEVWAPQFKLPMFCMEEPETVARRLFEQVDQHLRTAPDYLSITLLAYSSGSLLARRVFCMAHGADASGELTQPKAPWADRVQRLVMLAGITRGWEYSTAAPAHVRFLSPVLYGLARFVGFLKGIGAPEHRSRPFIWRLQRGSPFVVSTRIQYVKVIESLRRQARAAGLGPGLTAGGVPSSVFLLGARDEYVSPADCTELGPRAEFVYIELPGANHAEALLMHGDDEASRGRRSRVVVALSRPFDELRQLPWVVPPGDIDDYLDPMDLADGGPRAGADDAAVQHVVMIIHGIRDSGFWTKRVAREVKHLARQAGIHVRAPTPTYGYFSMWDFVKPGGRERAARWFMERYADVRSHYPGAKISFVGHSNGTYIAARALQLCSAIRLHKVVFAGSVVRCDYDWSRAADQVDAVLNYVGHADTVVAFLPAAFERLGLRGMDVGGAGAHGFVQAQEPHRSRLPFPLHEVRFVEGGHGAAIEEEYWPEIARFVVAGAEPARREVTRRAWLERAFRWAPAATTAGVLIAAVLLTAPLSAAAWVTAQLGASISSTLGAIAAVLAGVVVSWLAGRFLRAW